MSEQPTTAEEPLVIGSWNGQPGDEAPEEAEYFNVSYFGTILRVIADPLSMELSLEEFMDVASQLEETDPRAIGAIRTFIRSLVHPADFNKWWRVVRENRQGINAQMAFGKWLVEEVSGHPFGEPSGSDAGPLSTVLNSERASSWVVESLDVQHEHEQAGRADLGSIVLSARESRMRREAEAPSRG